MQAQCGSVKRHIVITGSTVENFRAKLEKLNLIRTKCEKNNRVKMRKGIAENEVAQLGSDGNHLKENAMTGKKVVQRSIIFGGLLYLSFVFSLSCTAEETLAAFKSRQAKIKASVKKVMPATVSITDRVGFGSGVIVSKDGYILTAGHVLTTNPENRELTVYFSDGSIAKAKPLGKNLDVDAGMAKLIGDKEWPYVDMGDSKNVRRGDWCICLGHSGGYELGRTPPVRTGKVLRNNNLRILTDCALIGGDSGGPLFDLDGNLIGITARLAVPLPKTDMQRSTHFFRIGTIWRRVKHGDNLGPNAEQPGSGL